MLIDVHTHVVPDRFPDNPSPETNPRWPCLCLHGDERGVIEFAGKAFRELDRRSWSVTRRLEDMDRDGVAAQVLSPMPELLSYWFPAREGLELGRYVNHVIADMMARAPSRFYGLAMVPLQDVELAAGELAALKRAGFAGVEIGSNINGLFPGEQRFEAFYAEAERLDLAIFVHALHPIGVERLAAFPDLVPYAAFALDTGLAALTLIRAGIVERFPRLRFGFSHGGGAIVALAHRLGQGWRLSNGFDGALREMPATQARRFFYDSLVYDNTYLDHLCEQFAPGQVFAGSDYPYAIEQQQLGAFVGPRVTAMGDAARRFLAVCQGNAEGPPGSERDLPPDP